MQICVTVFADHEPAEDSPPPTPLLAYRIDTPLPSPGQPLEAYIAQVIAETTEYVLGEAEDAEAAANAALAITEEANQQ